MIPYIENVSRPGMMVVFLVSYPVDGFIWAQRRVWYEAREAKKLVKLLLLGRKSRKAKQAASSGLRSSAGPRASTEPWMFTPAA